VGHDPAGKYSLLCIIPPCFFSITYVSCLILVLPPYMHIYLLPYMHIYHVYAIALQGGNTTPSSVADALLLSVSRLQVYARDC
jgi:hypothetical protein